MATAQQPPDVFDAYGGDRSDGSGRRGRGRDGGRRRHGRTRRVLLILLVILLVLVAGGALAFNRLQASLDHNIERFGNPFTAIPSSERPAVESADALNIMLLGSDSRVSAGDPKQWAVGAQRTDAIMIMHIPADRKSASIVSIPRDSWVDVPGYGKNKINAAFSFGGPTLMVRTVEQLTHVRIDHVAIVDFDGFVGITDELGGVDITIPDDTSDMRANFKAGTQHMDGATALNYVRERHGLPGGDFDRVKRQQNWIRSVLKAAVSKGTLTNPVKVNSVLSSLTRSLATDDDFTIGEMRGLAVSMRDIRAGDVDFLTAPVAGTGRSPDGRQAIVLLDTKADAPLWKALAGDTMAAYVASHRGSLLPETVL